MRITIARGSGCNTMFTNSYHRAANPNADSWERIRLYKRDQVLQYKESGCFMSGQFYLIATIPLLLGGLISLPGAITDIIKSERLALAGVVIFVCLLGFLCMYMLITRGTEQRLYRQITLDRDALHDSVEFSTFFGLTLCDGPGFLLTKSIDYSISPLQFVGWNRRVISYTWGAGSRGGTNYLDVFVIYYGDARLRIRRTTWPEDFLAQRKIAQRYCLKSMRFAVHRWSTRGLYDRDGKRYSAVPGGVEGDMIEEYLQQCLLSSSADTDTDKKNIYDANEESGHNLVKVSSPVVIS
mmetsp:Transcript_20218/g.30823  ORF Transcript_20218/g.30823 Transcript_20218/m.30823 type:complete len:296 (+) Transcript_20218:151-1038(+)